MIPTQRHQNAHCLQAYAQQLKKLQCEPSLKLGEEKQQDSRPSKAPPSIVPSIVDAVKRRRTAKKEAQEEQKVVASTSCTNKKSPPINAKRKQPAKKKENSKSSETNASKPKEAEIISQATERAKKAANLVGELLKDSEKARALLLHMTLTRPSSQGGARNTWPPRNSVIPNAFVWSNYPPLEALLVANEKAYYQLSIHGSLRSGQQLQFNKSLAQLVLETASEHGLEFDASCFSNEKILRDRIRDYYKTHTMNSKKRLMTMIGNPTKPSNVKKLTNLLAFLEELHHQSDDLEEKNAKIELPKRLEKDTALPSRAALRTVRRKATTIRICNLETSL